MPPAPPRRPPPPKVTAAIIGDPLVKPFNSTQTTPWFGQRGVPYWLLTEGGGARVIVTLESFNERKGDKKTTYVHSMEFKQGTKTVVTGKLFNVLGKWQLTVLANGQRMQAYESVQLPNNVTVTATPVTNGKPSGFFIRAPAMTIRIEQRPTQRRLAINPSIKISWLNIYITVTRPLRMPVGGLLGPGYLDSLVQPAAQASGGGVQGAAMLGSGTGPLLTASLTGAGFGV